MQTVANATFSQSIKKQSEINRKGLAILIDYYEQSKLILGASLHWSSVTHDLVHKLQNLVQEDAARCVACVPCLLGCVFDNNYMLRVSYCV